MQVNIFCTYISFSWYNLQLLQMWLPLIIVLVFLFPLPHWRLVVLTGPVTVEENLRILLASKQQYLNHFFMLIMEAGRKFIFETRKNYSIIRLNWLLVQMLELVLSRLNGMLHQFQFWSQGTFISNWKFSYPEV